MIALTAMASGKSSALIAWVAIGRQFQLLPKNDLPQGKRDFGLSYDDVDDDPARQDRAIGNITFTQQLAKATQFTIGLIWANKPEYRGDVDEELSARVGLNYKFGG